MKNSVSNLRVACVRNMSEYELKGSCAEISHHYVDTRFSLIAWYNANKIMPAWDKYIKRYRWNTVRKWFQEYVMVSSYHQLKIINKSSPETCKKKCKKQLLIAQLKYCNKNLIRKWWECCTTNQKILKNIPLVFHDSFIPTAINNAKY